jgi:hypothetical protein
VRWARIRAPAGPAKGPSSAGTMNSSAVCSTKFGYPASVWVREARKSGNRSGRPVTPPPITTRCGAVM